MPNQRDHARCREETESAIESAIPFDLLPTKTLIRQGDHLRYREDPPLFLHVVPSSLVFLQDRPRPRRWQSGRTR